MMAFNIHSKRQKNGSILWYIYVLKAWYSPYGNYLHSDLTLRDACETDGWFCTKEDAQSAVDRYKAFNLFAPLVFFDKITGEPI